MSLTVQFVYSRDLMMICCYVAIKYHSSGEMRSCCLEAEENVDLYFASTRISGSVSEPDYTICIYHRFNND